MRNMNLRKGSFGGARINAMGGDIVAAKAFSRKQAIFNEKAKQYASQGVITTPGYLRLETGATPNVATSVWNFNTLDTSGTKTATERRLKLSDTFTVTEIAFYIGTFTMAGSTPTASEYARQSLHTFPNPQITQIGAKADEVEAVYNGYLSLRIDTTTFLDSVPMRQFYRVGTSQQGVLGGSGGTAVQADEWTTQMYGRAELLPTIELNGQANIEWAINMPNAENLNAPSGFNNLVLILGGFLNQGAATVQRQLQKNLR
jgi:hypothetical protein